MRNTAVGTGGKAQVGDVTTKNKEQRKIYNA